MIHVLLVEPNILLSRTYTQALQHAGYQVVQVTSAQAAINAADQQTPDIVLLELQLPVHNGVEFLHEFRSYAEWQATPVIINTAMLPVRIAPLQQALAQDLGVQRVLYKPQATLQQLLRAVREHLVHI